MLPRPADGDWRRLTNAGLVQVDWCWRCNAGGVKLIPDPMVMDQIGVCYPCSTQRRIIMSKRLR